MLDRQPGKKGENWLGGFARDRWGVGLVLLGGVVVGWGRRCHDVENNGEAAMRWSRRFGNVFEGFPRFGKLKEESIFEKRVLEHWAFKPDYLCQLQPR